MADQTARSLVRVPLALSFLGTLLPCYSPLNSQKCTASHNAYTLLVYDFCSGYKTYSLGYICPECREPEKSQLTIFYGGEVLVFDDFSADKARDLMMLAGNGCGPSTNTGTAPQPAASSSASAEPKNPTFHVQPCTSRLTETIVAGLPIARKASLHRFLEKRKDRINASAPYQVKESLKMGESRPWLGLKPSPSSDCRR